MIGNNAEEDEVECEEASSATLTPFEYEPLELDKQAFRLIRVRPRKSDKAIEIEMWHSGMSTQYRCLSYMWGEDTDSNLVILNGRAFLVRKNLYDFLEFASQRYADEPLWIDAICIDQNNNAEKGNQVQRMGSIYSDAQEVVIWLGQDSQFKLIVDWLEVVPYGEYCSRDVEDQLQAICTHPYWSRAWIAQEIMLQSNIRILQQKTHIPWGEFGLKVLPIRSRSCVKNAPALPLIEMWLEHYARSWDSNRNVSSVWSPSTTKEISFWRLLTSRSQALCKDSRDRIYSILAMSSANDQKEDFVVEYSKDAVGLFVRAGERFGAWCAPVRILLLMRALDIPAQSLYQSMQRFRDIWFTFDIPYTCRLYTDVRNCEVFRMCTCSMLDLGRYSCIEGPARGVRFEISRPSDGSIKYLSEIWMRLSKTCGITVVRFTVQFKGKERFREGACPWAYLEEEIRIKQEEVDLQIRIPMPEMLEALDNYYSSGFGRLSGRRFI